MSYPSSMTLTHKTVVDDHGKPKEAIIPWEQFLEIQEMLGLPTSDEIAAIRSTEEDRKNGNTDNYTPLSEVKERLGL